MAGGFLIAVRDHEDNKTLHCTLCCLARMFCRLSGFNESQFMVIFMFYWDKNPSNDGSLYFKHWAQ